MQETHEHIVKQYDSELHRLTGEIMRMGELAIAQLSAAMDVLERRDSTGAQRVVAADEAIDALEHEVSHDVVRLLALRQPMARDLREILASLRIASDIERIGDYAANAAKRAIVLNQSPAIPAVPMLGALNRIATDMLREVLAAYRDRDDVRAMIVRARDAELDALYTGLFRELLTYMAEDPRSISSAIHVMFVAKNLERVGDHATNIAENIWFIVHGSPLLDEREKRDFTSVPAQS
jgi:phosphate transport system protein